MTIHIDEDEEDVHMEPSDLASRVDSASVTQISEKTLRSIGLDQATYQKYVVPVLGTQKPQRTEEPMEVNMSKATPPIPIDITGTVMDTPTPSTSTASNVPPLPTLSQDMFEQVLHGVQDTSQGAASASVTEVKMPQNVTTVQSGFAVQGQQQSQISEQSIVSPAVLEITEAQAIKSISKIGVRFYCPFVACRKDYAHKSDCNKHVKEHFKEKEIFKCEICSAQVATAKNLLEHTHGVHIKGEYLYNCKCGKGFYYSSHMSGHRRMCSFKPSDENNPDKDVGENKEKKEEVGEKKNEGQNE